MTTTITLADLARHAFETAPERFTALYLADPEKATRILTRVAAVAAQRLGLTVV